MVIMKLKKDKILGTSGLVTKTKFNVNVATLKETRYLINLVLLSELILIQNLQKSNIKYRSNRMNSYGS